MESTSGTKEAYNLGNGVLAQMFQDKRSAVNALNIRIDRTEIYAVADTMLLDNKLGFAFSTARGFLDAGNKKQFQREVKAYTFVIMLLERLKNQKSQKFLPTLKSHLSSLSQLMPTKSKSAPVQKPSERSDEEEWVLIDSNNINA